MDLSVLLAVAIVADLLLLRFIPARRGVVRFVCMSVLFIVQTILVVALIGSPLHPVFRPKDLPREFWLQIFACIYVCSGVAMVGFVFALPLQGIVATSGIIAIVLGLALQSTLGDVFSGLS